VNNDGLSAEKVAKDGDDLCCFRGCGYSGEFMRSFNGLMQGSNMEIPDYAGDGVPLWGNHSVFSWWSNSSVSLSGNLEYLNYAKTDASKCRDQNRYGPLIENHIRKIFDTKASSGYQADLQYSPVIIP
jgi:hypothetical protein